ncbi:FAD-dependent oxidoreductase [Pseudomonas sp. M5]|uniref:NAD(P)/FAD-dependent oxidoreductase n=1 Tax=Pseudomonas sp. M5 TaxID=1620788 RepID=UPI0018CAE568|nr:FAD-dependent oxidoreductase [Pseudomonas sp. M5]MBM7395518.1 glycine/D-amino acid oxidase-like deaminating enzyme [Pseudomonas sp. M5]QPN47421.1 FAD-binding oxidoreductase [Priestia aryabhattai]HDS1758843.1 FAD-binding oxidoreductase [Pseudomonas putida]
MSGARFFDAVVVGAGITGLCTALHLARRGRSVALLEQQAEPDNATANSGAGVRFFDPDAQISEWVRESHDFYQSLGAAWLPAPALYCLQGDTDDSLETARLCGFRSQEFLGLKALYPAIEWAPSALAIEDSDAGFRDPLQVTQLLLRKCHKLRVYVGFAEPVTELQIDLRHKLRTPSGLYSTDQLLFACGYWSPEVMQRLGLPAHVRNRTVTIHYLDKAPTVPFLVEHLTGFHMRSTASGGLLFGLPQLDFDIPAQQLPDRAETQGAIAYQHLRQYLPVLPAETAPLRTVRSADAWPLLAPAPTLPNNIHHLAFGQGSAFKYAPAATLAYLDQHLR